jgi:hypothetical protein
MAGVRLRTYRQYSLSLRMAYVGSLGPFAFRSCKNPPSSLHGSSLRHQRGGTGAARYERTLAAFPRVAGTNCRACLSQTERPRGLVWCWSSRGPGWVWTSSPLRKTSSQMLGGNGQAEKVHNPRGMVPSQVVALAYSSGRSSRRQVEALLVTSRLEGPTRECIHSSRTVCRLTIWAWYVLRVDQALGRDIVKRSCESKSSPRNPPASASPLRPYRAGISHACTTWPPLGW